MPWFRIKLDQISEEDPAPMVLTVPLGPDQCIAVEIPFAGWWGKLRGNAWFRPIVCKPDGTVEFSGDPEDDQNERVSDMQIFGKPFELGKMFYMKDREDGEVYEFVVREISPLLG